MRSEGREGSAHLYNITHTGMLIILLIFEHLAYGMLSCF